MNEREEVLRAKLVKRTELLRSMNRLLAGGCIFLLISLTLVVAHTKIDEWMTCRQGHSFFFCQRVFSR